MPSKAENIILSKAVKIFVAIPVYNRRELTRKCLLDLFAQSYRNFEVVICDDGSTDGTSEMIKNEFPKVVLLKGDGSLYWSGGYNRCLEYIFDRADDDDYVLSLNNDVEFEQDYFARLLVAAKDNPDSLVMSAACNKDNPGKPLVSGYNMNLVTMRPGRVYRTEPNAQYGSVNSVYGRGLLIPVNLAKKAGLADEKRFPMVGDHDLSLRYHKLGIRAIIAYGAKIYTGPSYTNEHYFKNYSFENFFKYITDIRSTGNLKYRFWAIVKNRPLLLIPANLFFDINCVLFGYFKRWILSLASQR